MYQSCGLIEYRSCWSHVSDGGKPAIGITPTAAGLVLEANERYWRKVPSIKRIIYKGIPESPTRLAMLKTGEADKARQRSAVSTQDSVVVMKTILALTSRRACMEGVA